MTKKTRRSSRKQAPKTRAVGYVRVSTDKQADDGVSLEAQEVKLRAYAELYDIELVTIIVDAGVSAKSLERPGLARAFGMLEAGQADALLVAKLDRLTRSVSDLGWLVEAERVGGRWTLLSVADSIDTRSAAGRLVLNVLGSVSQWERETIAERTSAAMQHKRSRGEYLGGKGAPYGYTSTPSGIVQDKAEQRIIRAARRLHKGGRSLRGVAAELERRGMLSRSGRPFAAVQVQRMVEAEARPVAG